MGLVSVRRGEDSGHRAIAGGGGAGASGRMILGSAEVRAADALRRRHGTAADVAALRAVLSNTQLQRVAASMGAGRRRTLARHRRSTGPGTVDRSDRVPAGGIRVTLTNFDIDGDDLKPEHRSVLDTDIVPAAVGHPVRVYLRGSASRSSDPAHNQALSERRMSAVARYLGQHGVPTAQISTSAVGASMAMAPEDSGDRAVGVLIVPLSAPPPPPLPVPAAPAATAVYDFTVVPSTISRFREIMIASLGRELRPAGLTQMVDQILSAIGTSGRIHWINLWDEGATDVPGLSVGRDLITMGNLHAVLKQLRRLRGRFATEASIFVHNCNAGSTSLILLQFIAHALQVPVLAGTGLTLGFILTGENLGGFVRVEPDGSVHPADQGLSVPSR